MKLGFKAKTLSVFMMLGMVSAIGNNSFVCGSETQNEPNIANETLSVWSDECRAKSVDLRRAREEERSGVSLEDERCVRRMLSEMSPQAMRNFWFRIISFDDVNLIDHILSLLDEATYNECVNVLSLNYAISKAAVHICEYFLEKGVNPNSVDAYGNTPLMSAAKWASVCDYQSHRIFQKILALLLQYRANVNLQDQKGNSILHYVAQTGSYIQYDYLLGCGADEQLKNNKGESSQELFLRQEKRAITRL